MNTQCPGFQGGDSTLVVGEGAVSCCCYSHIAWEQGSATHPLS